MWTDTNKCYVKTMWTYANKHLFKLCGGIQINFSFNCVKQDYTLKNLHFTAYLRTDLYLLLILLTEKI